MAESQKALMAESPERLPGSAAKLVDNSESSSEAGQPALGEAARFTRAASPINVWVLKTLAMLLLLSGAAFVIYFAPGALMMLAALPIIPYTCIVNDLRSDFDSLLMIYEEERRSLVMFWRNVLQVRRRRDC